MKNKLFIAVILLFLAVPAFSQNDTVFSFNIGNLGIGANFPFNYVNDVDIHFSLINFGLEHKGSNIGFVISPFVVTGFSDTEDPNFEGISLLNLNVYWNVYSGSTFFFGPYASINYLFVDTDFYWDKFIFNAGVQVGMRLSFKGFRYNIFTFEAGYRNINGAGRYYIGAKVDLLTIFVTSLLGGLFY